MPPRGSKLAHLPEQRRQLAHHFPPGAPLPRHPLLLPRWSPRVMPQ